MSLHLALLGKGQAVKARKRSSSHPDDMTACRLLGAGALVFQIPAAEPVVPRLPGGPFLSVPRTFYVGFDPIGPRIWLIQREECKGISVLIPKVPGENRG